jgi:hypothetical protein
VRFFFDTEFIEDGHTRPLELISIGMVTEDGCGTLYMENEGADLSHANPWVKDNVLPHLRADARVSRAQLASSVYDFVSAYGPKPEFWGYFADYDWVVFCQLFGRMIDLPKGWPMYCRDLKQLADERGIRRETFPAHDGPQHNALADAQWSLKLYRHILGG